MFSYIFLRTHNNVYKVNIDESCLWTNLKLYIINKHTHVKIFICSTNQGKREHQFEREWCRTWVRLEGEKGEKKSDIIMF